jgi:hypothetical protein
MGAGFALPRQFRALAREALALALAAYPKRKWWRATARVILNQQTDI